MDLSLFARVFPLILMLVGCDRFDSIEHSNAAEPVVQTKQPANLPKGCKQLVKVQDIWQLEPMLVKSGKIKESMSRAEKETIIHQYIEAKNRQYKVCISSKG